MDAQVGDRITIHSNRVGAGERSGEIVNVVAASTGKQYRVRWDDGHETTFFPGSDASVERAGTGKR
jgi:hypothetical protein